MCCSQNVTSAPKTDTSRKLLTVIFSFLLAVEKKMGLGTLIGGAAAIGCCVVALPLVGFTAGGIAAGSIASSMMSAAAVANGGGVASMAAGGVVATCQSIGAAGLTVKSVVALGAAGGAAGEAVAKLLL